MTIVKGYRVPITQNTPEWLQWRRLGGSDAGVLMGISPWCGVRELWERKLGIIPDIVQNEAMRRGHEKEPEARILLEMEKGILLPAACYEHPDFTFATASADGIDESEEIISEIKCPGLNSHLKTINGTVQPYYIAQCQHNMGVTGAKLCYYYSYADFYEEQPTKLIEIPRDDAYIERIFEREKVFWDCLQTKTSPDEDWFGVKDGGLYNGHERSDPMWRAALAELRESTKLLQDAQAQYDLRIQRVEQLMQKKKQVLVIGNGARIERVLSEQGWKTDVTFED